MMTSDLKLTIRSLLKSPAFTVAAILTLGFCIGANVVIFAVVNSILLRPLPFAQPNRLVTVINSYPRAGIERLGVAVADYYAYQTGIKAFASSAIYQSNRAAVGEAGHPKTVGRLNVSPEFFATLGVPLALGRGFSEREMAPGSDRVAILSDALWRRQFNADPKVLGRRIRIDSQPFTIVGVLPRGFRFLSIEAQVFTPAASLPWQRESFGRHNYLGYQLIARLGRDATVNEAQSQIDAFNRQAIRSDAAAAFAREGGYRTDVYALHADSVREVRPVLWILQGGVLLLLLIGAFNLINLLLIRASGQSKEWAVRQALGARPQHVARATLMETVVLAVGGGLLGLGLGALGIHLLSLFGIDRLPFGTTIALDGRVATVALAVSLIAGIALAVPVFLYSLRAWVAVTLRCEGRTGTAGTATQRLRYGFIVTQVALSFVLLSGAGLLALSLKQVLASSPGFLVDHVMTGELWLSAQRYQDPRLRMAFVNRLLAELRGQPGITAAGVTSQLPLVANPMSVALAVEGRPTLAGKSLQTHYSFGVSGGYFQALGIPAVNGRLLEDADNERGQRVCVIDEALARRYWPNINPLGRRVADDFTFHDDRACTVVGVVGNVRQAGLAKSETHGSIYFPYRQYPNGFTFPGLGVILRTRLDSSVQTALLKKAMLKIDPELPVEQLQSMNDRIDDSLVSRRSPVLLSGIFAVMALLLAAVGTYGVLAYAVSQRKREIGVRMALGATPGGILTHYLGISGKLLGAGVLLGVAGAWVTGKAMQSVLFGVDGFQLSVLIAAATVITVAVLFATFLPSFRASRGDPLVALRAE